jgi:hypothetical protein
VLRDSALTRQANIFLDDYFNVKLGDFGLALDTVVRLFPAVLRVGCRAGAL